jgi:hypothetical protein
LPAQQPEVLPATATEATPVLPALQPESLPASAAAVVTELEPETPEPAPGECFGALHVMSVTCFARAIQQCQSQTMQPFTELLVIVHVCHLVIAQSMTVQSPRNGQEPSVGGRGGCCRTLRGRLQPPQQHRRLPAAHQTGVTGTDTRTRLVSIKCRSCPCLHP